MEREAVHKSITDLYELFEKRGSPKDVSTLFKHESHFSYIYSFLTSHTLYPFFDIQKPWLIYWGLNSLHILRETNSLSEEDKRYFGEYILSFQCKSGGFCGGHGYPANMATSYASVLALALLELPEYFDRIDKQSMKNFIMSCQTDQKGAYRVHKHGEVDLRCTFIAVLITSSLNIIDELITEGIVPYIASCQSYEGGISPIPEVEAHGGYTFCGVATLALLGSLEKINLKKLTYWLSNMQTEYGGFCGRTNKLVDSCYSFWQATSFHIIKEYFEGKQCLRMFFGVKEQKHGTEGQEEESPLPSEHNYLESEDLKLLIQATPNAKGHSPVAYNVGMLQKYILLCCQSKKGGLQDKPTKSVDIYHTMYAMSGLALSSHELGQDSDVKFDWSNYFLDDMDPIFNIPKEIAEKFVDHFRS